MTNTWQHQVETKLDSRSGDKSLCRLAALLPRLRFDANFNIVHDDETVTAVDSYVAFRYAPVMPRVTKRIRDSVHGLITFDMGDEVDRAAWRLISTPEFQRLRRIKQLGVSEFTFPGATHTRLAHCIGVFHVARNLMGLAEAQIAEHDQNEQRMRVALLASLLHDLGHGPFSHAFEEAEKVRLRDRVGAYKHHEQWTAEIITRADGEVRRVLTECFGGRGGIADDIADLLVEEPADLYAAVVSSSFDADRLDYLQRDKLMTGSGAGAIDFPWLLDNLRITTVPVDPEDAEGADAGRVKTFCFAEKAVQAAESFILARYHLYSQVYFHRTTRGIEQLLSAFLRTVAAAVAGRSHQDLCLPDDHPLVAYYLAEAPTIDQYLALDDTVIWSAIEAARRGRNPLAANLADRLRTRRRLKAVEISTDNPSAADRARRTYIEQDLANELGVSVFRDRVPLTIYGQNVDPKPHKAVRIIGKDYGAVAVDITSVSKAIAALTEKQELLRYYFLDDAVADRVANMRG